MSIVNIIKSSPLFYELYDDEIDHLIQNCHVLSLESGEFVIKDGEEGSEIYLILSGGAYVKKGDVTLVELRKGDLFGEMVLLDERKRTADIVASSHSDVLVIDYDTIFNTFSKNPKIFSILILNLCRLLAKRLKGSSEEIKRLNGILSAIQNSEEAA